MDPNFILPSKKRKTSKEEVVKKRHLPKIEVPAIPC